MNYRTRFALLALLPALAVACDSVPTDEGESDLTVELAVSPGHVHIWQTDVTFTASVTDDAGEAVTDFEEIRVERRLHDADSWGEVELTPSGDAYTGTYVFSSSGEYDIRVVGARPGDDEASVLHVMDGHLEVVRAHTDAGGYTVEFETFPGHIHAGDAASLRFWVTDGDTEVEGLEAEVHVSESGSVDELRPAEEVEPGVYEAEHSFEAAGPTHAGLHFAGAGGADAEGAFDIEISEAH